MPSPGYTTLPYTTAKELWDVLSPEQTIGDTPGRYIFRGQGDARWGLVPSVLRHNSPVRRFIAKAIHHVEIQIWAEMELLNQFVGNCDALALPIPSDSITLRRRLDTNSKGDLFLRYPAHWPSADLAGLLAVAQHHKVPTRLLDWTKRSYVAAYFAATTVMGLTGSNAPAEIAIWALETSKLRPLGVPDEASAGGIYPNLNLVTAPGAVTANLAAQAGLFTVLRERGFRGQSVTIRSLEEELSLAAESPLWKLTLPATESANLLQLCRLYSITAATLFPSYDGAGAAVLEVAQSWKPMPPGSAEPTSN